ncbi:MAG: 23S rRNA (cytidine1920-2'-O)/16S rRNA (cytidine1409-2'-O)-methyltransferase [Polyangiales bacterium]
MGQSTAYVADVAKTRADVLLVERQLVQSRARAQALILAGKVFTSDRRIEKAGERIADDAPLEVRGQDIPFVSRGGLKLQDALNAFEYDPNGKAVADFGSSTGGFTDCLLQRGAVRVYAIDVGWGQLHNKLRQDERVIVMERVNARHLTNDDLPEPVQLVVIDASFIGIAKLLPAVRAVLGPGGDVLAMVKPQFEVGRERVGRGGVVRNEAHRLEAIDNVAKAGAALGFEEVKRADNEVTGPKGNREAFLWLRLL